eukprot:SAG31_NODE_15618_length_746_cov_1.375580_1_plen_190_part_10
MTGACGKIAGQVLPALRDRYDLVLLDVANNSQDGLVQAQICDLLSDDREPLRKFIQGADAVVHFGFKQPPPDPSLQRNSAGGLDQSKPSALPPELLFGAEHDNVKMAFNIYQTALEERVRRVVVASSNHAADFYEPHRRLVASARISIFELGRPARHRHSRWSRIGRDESHVCSTRVHTGHFEPWGSCYF